jgi:hypothetical protein
MTAIFFAAVRLLRFKREFDVGMVAAMSVGVLIGGLVLANGLWLAAHTFHWFGFSN